MSVLAWSPEKRLLVMFHKILRWERRAGQATAIVNLSPASVGTLPLQPGETMIGEVTNRTGRRFRFGKQAVYIESDRQWIRGPYDSILAYHCMAERTNIPQDESLKREYYRSLKKTMVIASSWLMGVGAATSSMASAKRFQDYTTSSPGCWFGTATRPKCHVSGRKGNKEQTRQEWGQILFCAFR